MEFENAINEAGITISAQPGFNPFIDDAKMTHWTVVLHLEDRDLQTSFSMGSAYKGRAPRPEEVLHSLFMDASFGESCATFEDFCREFGHDVVEVDKLEQLQDSWKQCVKTDGELRIFLGDRFDELQKLAWEY